MSLLETPIARLDGGATTLGEITGGKPALLVNVASQCGLTPQYTGLERLHKEYADAGFTVVGIPCNQFGGQEPGSSEEIEEFCSTNYGVTFPMTEKIEVNGAQRHPLYAELVKLNDEKDRGGDVAWNFEKFLVDGSGSVLARFSPQVEPEDPRLREAVDKVV